MNALAPRYTVEMSPDRDAKGRFMRKQIVARKVEPWLEKDGKRKRNPAWRTAPMALAVWMAPDLFKIHVKER